VQKVHDGCTTIKTTIKKHAANGHSQKARDRGQATIFLQQAEWRSCQKGVDIIGKLFLCTASPSGLGQQGHETLRASCVPLTAIPSSLSHQGHETLRASCVIGGSHAKGRQWDSSATMPKMASTGGSFCWESDSTCVNLDTRLTQSAAF
jgi:hypothetical protein